MLGLFTTIQGSSCRSMRRRARRLGSSACGGAQCAGLGSWPSVMQAKQALARPSLCLTVHCVCWQLPAAARCVPPARTCTKRAESSTRLWSNLRRPGGAAAAGAQTPGVQRHVESGPAAAASGTLCISERRTADHTPERGQPSAARSRHTAAAPPAHQASRPKLSSCRSVSLRTGCGGGVAQQAAVGGAAGGPLVGRRRAARRREAAALPCRTSCAACCAAPPNTMQCRQTNPPWWPRSPPRCRKTSRGGPPPRATAARPTSSAGRRRRRRLRGAGPGRGGEARPGRATYAWGGHTAGRVCVQRGVALQLGAPS